MYIYVCMIVSLKVIIGSNRTVAPSAQLATRFAGEVRILWPFWGDSTHCLCPPHPANMQYFSLMKIYIYIYSFKYCLSLRHTHTCTSIYHAFILSLKQKHPYIVRHCHHAYPRTKIKKRSTPTWVEDDCSDASSQLLVYISSQQCTINLPMMRMKPGSSLNDRLMWLIL
jgi:hypothetical protein